MLALISKAAAALTKLRDRGLDVGQLVGPRDWHVPWDGPWAADNDGFQGVDVPAYMAMLSKIAGTPNCLFVALPDVLYDARATMHEFAKWQPIVRGDLGMPVAYVLQDGIEGVGVPWEQLDAVFIGGTTGFKFSDVVARIAAEAKRRDKWVHMGRVNTKRRIDYAASIGCDSIDGTKWSRWLDTWAHELHRLPYAQSALSALEEK